MKTSKIVSAILIVTIIVTILLVTLFMQSVNTPVKQITTQEKALAAIKDILQLDFSKYTPELYNNFSYNSVNYAGLLEEDLAYNLEANDSKLFVTVSFVNNSFRYIDISSFNGSASAHYSQQLPTESVAATKVVLSRLQNFTDSQTISQMQDLIKEVTDINSANKTAGNLKCQVLINSMTINQSYTSKSISVYFMYTFNGADSPKSISIHFQDGVLKTVANTWNLFEVGNQEIKISREQAIEIAKTQANNSTTAPLNFTSLRPIIAELRMVVRENLRLYPLWSVELPLDYSGSSVNGWHTTIWADTGEVASGTPLFGSMS